MIKLIGGWTLNISTTFRDLNGKWREGETYIDIKEDEYEKECMD